MATIPESKVTNSLDTTELDLQLALDEKSVHWDAGTMNMTYMYHRRNYAHMNNTRTLCILLYVNR